MPLYGSIKPTDVTVGQSDTLFDGTETIDVGSRSIAIARGTQGSSDNGMSFFMWGAIESDEIDILAAMNDDPSQYILVGSLIADANGNAAYTDVGRAAFYLAEVTTLSSPSGGARVGVQR